jgi:hypothetical protein
MYSRPAGTLTTQWVMPLLTRPAGRLQAAAVAAESPAIWPSFWAAHSVKSTAFDSAAEWQTHDVLAHVGALAGIPVRVDCGWLDPFLSASESLARVLPSDDVHSEPGGQTLNSGPTGRRRSCGSWRKTSRSAELRRVARSPRV